MNKLHLLKIALLIVILAEEIKRATKKEELFDLLVEEDDHSGFGLKQLNQKELIRQINNIESAESIRVVSTR
ncbi:hypothetical protein [Macrococcoides canis]|uniref:hypothetical protein n=1 Tax=Macrococcoides canis TaxID=1855823 RepID=UPI00165DF86D|nr:hypothetical protein [Macrococcus canis]MCO4095744.1 hypothetical protein [Macrococcus canis]QNR08266.1 hypothetical protein GL258_08335 [Macrococcus canis]UTH10430.1 hypothetical protein KFV08_07920 [Macrococcus canis]